MVFQSLVHIWRKTLSLVRRRCFLIFRQGIFLNMYLDIVMEHMHEEYADMYLCRNAENGELPCFFDGYDPVAYVQYVITETGYMKEITLLLDNSLYSNILKQCLW